MHDGAVESTRYPRNPLDILAQQIVAMTSMDAWDVDDLFATVRRAAPFAELSRTVFDGVLDMLSGPLPVGRVRGAAAAHHLGPRRRHDVAREGAKRVAIANGGTIPDRGLYGVFLAGADPGPARVGELDEEMVFESQAGETFVLGASTLAHRGDHARPRPRLARARRTGQDALLERRSRFTGDGLDNGWFFEPTIFARVEAGSRLEQEEIFGPVLSVIRFRTVDEAFAINNDVRYGLSSSVYTRDVNVAMRALNELDNGITYINAPTIGAEAHLPFGGVKQTGNGHREGGWEVYEFYSETKVGYLDFSGALQRAQIDTYDV